MTAAPPFLPQSVRAACTPLLVLCQGALRTLGLTYAHIDIYCAGMARAATTADAFNSIAEPRRRQILDALAGGEGPVNDLVRQLGLAQPQVSKHLRVLREVGAVDVRRSEERRGGKGGRSR